MALVRGEAVAVVIRGYAERRVRARFSKCTSFRDGHSHFDS